MKVIVGCEFSQVVTRAFRDRGHEAFSCDLLPTEGNPDWHFQEDIFEVLKREKFDMGIFHPPCTYLTVTGNSWFNIEKYGDRAIKRVFDRHEALGFFLKLYYAPIEKIAIENPIGYLSSAFRKPDQIVHPYYFGDPESKSTCLWLKNLPPLRYRNGDTLFGSSTAVEPAFHIYADGRRDPKWHFESLQMEPAERAKYRSKTFGGMAAAFAEQWG